VGGAGGTRGTPAALSLLPTPLRYYSRAFLRRTAKILYGPIISDENTLLREDISAWRARPPTLWGYLGQLAAAAGWTSLPRLHRITAPTMIISGTADPIVPPVNARILARRIPSARLELIQRARHLV